MTLAAILTLLTSIFKAIPVLKQFWDSLVSAYIAREIESMRKENVDAIKRALSEHDQRPIEHILDPSKDGLISGLPGSVAVPYIPGIGMSEPGKSTSKDLAK